MIVNIDSGNLSHKINIQIKIDLAASDWYMSQKKGLP